MTAKREKLIIAVDGPAGAGKSTVAQKLARDLGVLYIDTGAMYRALTLKAIQKKLNLKDEAALAGEARRINIEFRESGKKRLIFLDGKDVSRQIRTPQLTKKIAAIARMSRVRREMVKLQRRMARANGAVMEGRDIGTVVFPDADYKFYLDAHFEERIKRRFKDMSVIDRTLSVEDVREDIMSRDASDRTRKVAPLRIADDAIFVDTTNLSVTEVVKRLKQEIGQ